MVDAMLFALLLGLAVWCAHVLLRALSAVARRALRRRPLSDNGERRLPLASEELE